jgi:hypothetical protein
MSDARSARPRNRGWSIALLAVVAIGAAACGSGSGGSSVRVPIAALLRSTGCPAVKPHQGPFQGSVALTASEGHGRLVRLDDRGRAEVTLPPGKYRVAVVPRAHGRVDARYGGRTLPADAAGRPLMTIGSGDVGTLAITVVTRAAECNGLGASG